MTAHHSSADNPGDPVGWYAYRAGYTMAMNPKVTLSTERAPQGSIVAVQLSGILDGEPSLETDLGTVWFRKTASGYMGYIPVTYNAEGGDHTLHLTCGSLEKDITLTVTRTMYDTVTVPAEEDTGGGEEFRNAIWPLYTTGSSAKLWNGRFEAPSAGAVAMEYGVTQMVDGQRSGQAAHMILVGVGAEHILQLLHAEILQVRDNIAAVVHVAAVVEHILAVTFHQHAQGLPHIQEVHLKVGGPAVSGRLGSADRRGAAARHHRRGITGGKAKGQRRRQGQSGNAPPEAYFFFFEVFHVVFSFC